MTFSIHFFILFAVALLCCAIGFYKYVYFISIGYGAAIAGQGIALLVMFRGDLTWPMAALCVLMILYGCRLSGYLLLREIKSVSYQRHMKTEIKDGSGMKPGIKVLLWVSCGLLYVLMVSPIFYRMENGDVYGDIAFFIGITLMVLGLILESASDISKNRQKKIHPKRFCDKGLFRIVRCPNYLGELIIWTGIFVVGTSSFCAVGQWIVAIVGYLGIIYVMFSGARRLEIRQNKNYGGDPEYQAYVKKVPIMIPFVPLYSVEKYKFLVL